MEGREFLDGSDEKFWRMWLGRELFVAGLPPLLQPTQLPLATFINISQEVVFSVSIDRSSKKTSSLKLIFIELHGGLVFETDSLKILKCLKMFPGDYRLKGEI